ncbi:hypothetical protein LSH36_532g06041 [Paralvinella palmiformis]|uniref:F-box domain-containing protein n=1 Tax=Paralvinella palmiformis TaxID=53620 RepID=A0AAD9J7B4_9ANNE|nr:hypothetical protein LSH36_532g06041 [Paralvinella palmiformis]
MASVFINGRGLSADLVDHFLMQGKADSCDSGNEEPYVESDFYMPERLGMEHVTLHIAPKSDKLVERITALSTPRDFHLEKLPEGLIDSLPSEVLLVVFRYLDDISLWTAHNVCSRWRSLLDAEMADIEWKRFIKLRWPLFKPEYDVQCWKTLYSKLLVIIV